MKPLNDSVSLFKNCVQSEHKNEVRRGNIKIDAVVTQNNNLRNLPDVHT